tara:strand:+ start:73 stop:495 length:423 start_codon:yes stop_codon:yes gene_type:complete
MKLKVPAILKNKYVCYALMALAGLNVVGYITVKAWECLALFILTAYSAKCYCNNTSCAILAALFVANFVFGCGRVKEGMEEKMEDDDEKAAKAAAKLGEVAESQAAEGDEDAAAAAGAAANAAEEVAGMCSGPDCKKKKE